MTRNAYSSIRAFRTIFQQHSKAKDFEIPHWLNKGEVKTFFKKHSCITIN